MSLFEGCATALITPFTPDGVDFSSLEKLLEFQIEGGIDGLVICGTTGEPSTMTDAEKTAVIKFAVEKIGGRVPVIAGSGGNNTAEVIAKSKAYADLGVDGLLVVTPYYNKCTQKGLVEHYTAVARSVDIPIICYNVPGRTGVNLLPATFKEIAAIDNIDGIKEASGNMDQITDCARCCQGLACVYSGDDGIAVPVMSVGGKGLISVASNIMPRYMHDMIKAYLGGDTLKAAEMQLNVYPLVKALFSEVNPIPAKKAASFMGLCSDYVRLPLTVMEEANAQKLYTQMKGLQLVK